MKKPLQFFATFFLCAAFVLNVAAQETLIRNGDFTGPRVEPGWVNIHEITNTTGAEFWHVQFNQALTQDQIDNLEAGETYELTFYAKAGDDKEIAVFFGEEGGDFHNLLDPDLEDNGIIELTTEEQSFSFEFVADTFDAMKLGFEGGKDDNSYSIGHVSILKKVEEGEDAGDDIINNGHFGPRDFEDTWFVWVADWEGVTASALINDWFLWYADWEGIIVDLTIEDGWANIHDIDNTPGSEFWHIQFNQEFTASQIGGIIPGASYTLMFDAKAEADKQIHVFFGEDGGSFRNLLDPDQEDDGIIDLTAEEQSFSMEFTGETFDAMKLGFEGGLDNNGYSISNVEILLDEPPATVVDIIVSSHLHETLATAVVAADLVDALSGEGPFTVFAPTDDAFAALPDGVLDDLLDDPDGELTDILLYHVVAASALSTDLEDGQEITTMLDENVLVTINEEGVFINDAEVIVADLLAENGVVHVIDAVLLPPDDDTSISDLDAASFKVYPNPASDRLHVNTDKGAAITLINTMGSVVHSRTAESDKISLDVSSLPVGIYFISVENKGERVTQKVIVK